MLWGREIGNHPPTVTHESVMKGDQGIYDMLENIVLDSPCLRPRNVLKIFLQVRFGFCFIDGVDATPEATEELTLRIGNIRHTQCMHSLRIILIFDYNCDRWRILGFHVGSRQRRHRIHDVGTTSTH